MDGADKLLEARAIVKHLKGEKDAAYVQLTVDIASSYNMMGPLRSRCCGVSTLLSRGAAGRCRALHGSAQHVERLHRGRAEA